MGVFDGVFESVFEGVFEGVFESVYESVFGVILYHGVKLTWYLNEISLADAIISIQQWVILALNSGQKANNGKTPHQSPADHCVFEARYYCSAFILCHRLLGVTEPRPPINAFFVLIYPKRYSVLINFVPNLFNLLLAYLT